MVLERVDDAEPRGTAGPSDGPAEPRGTAGRSDGTGDPRGTTGSSDGTGDPHALTRDEYLRRGRTHLTVDPVLAPLVGRIEPPEPRRDGDLYIDLIDGIVSQQLSVKAAAAIMGRFLALFPDGRPEPGAVRSRDEETLRGVGLSRPKIRYLYGITEAIETGEINLPEIARLGDEEFIREITRLKGVGRWTAEMLLIFSLGRRDVFSLGDLGLRTAVSRLYEVDREDYDAIAKIASSWKPYRSLACHYLWKSLNNEPGVGARPARES
ncbi:MAG: DNA-3-methyladenine glycosylase family protein [Alkalispirochaeta sp.]